MKVNKNQYNSNTIHLIITVLICVIALMVCACTATHDKDTSSINKVTDQVSKNDDSNAGNTGDDQEIECRNLHITGSRFKNRVCTTKAEWAIKDGKNNEETDEFSRDVSRRSGVNTGSGSEMSGGMPR